MQEVDSRYLIDQRVSCSKTPPQYLLEFFFIDYNYYLSRGNHSSVAKSETGLGRHYGTS